MKDWLAEGKGVFYLKNGERYEGDFKKDKPDGNGIYYYKDGSRQMGDYSNGKRIKKHVKMDNSGEVTFNNY